jgi:hypothetical protein
MGDFPERISSQDSIDDVPEQASPLVCANGDEK